MPVALLERDDELALLAASLDRARTGAGGSVVLLSGEAGVGKTSLVRAFTVHAREGARVLLGACDDLLPPPPGYGERCGTWGSTRCRAVRCRRPGRTRSG